MKDLDRLPPRILTFCLHLDRFSYDIKHVPGKELYTADTLSRAPIQSQNADSPDMQEIPELCMMSIIKHLPASNQRLEMYRKAQSEDPICQQLVRYCQTAWPDMKDLDPSERVYWQFQGEMIYRRWITTAWTKE